MLVQEGSSTLIFLFPLRQRWAGKLVSLLHSVSDTVWRRQPAELTALAYRAPPHADGLAVNSRTLRDCLNCSFHLHADWQPARAFWGKIRILLLRTQQNIHNPIFTCTISSKFPLIPKLQMLNISEAQSTYHFVLHSPTWRNHEWWMKNEVHEGEIASTIKEEVQRITLVTGK